MWNKYRFLSSEELQDNLYKLELALNDCRRELEIQIIKLDNHTVESEDLIKEIIPSIKERLLKIEQQLYIQKTLQRDRKQRLRVLGTTLLTGLGIIYVSQDIITLINFFIN